MIWFRKKMKLWEAVGKWLQHVLALKKFGLAMIEEEGKAAAAFLNMTLIKLVTTVMFILISLEPAVKSMFSTLSLFGLGPSLLSPLGLQERNVIRVG